MPSPASAAGTRTPAARVAVSGLPGVAATVRSTAGRRPARCTLVHASLLDDEAGSGAGVPPAFAFGAAEAGRPSAGDDQAERIGADFRRLNRLRDVNGAPAAGARFAHTAAPTHARTLARTARPRQAGGAESRGCWRRPSSWCAPRASWSHACAAGARSRRPLRRATSAAAAPKFAPPEAEGAPARGLDRLMQAARFRKKNNAGDQAAGARARCAPSHRRTRATLADAR